MAIFSNNYGVSPSGKAADFDSAMRRFEPYHPNSNYKIFQALVMPEIFSSWLPCISSITLSLALQGLIAHIAFLHSLTTLWPVLTRSEWAH